MSSALLNQRQSFYIRLRSVGGRGFKNLMLTVSATGLASLDEWVWTVKWLGACQGHCIPVLVSRKTPIYNLAYVGRNVEVMLQVSQRSEKTLRLGVRSSSDAESGDIKRLDANRGRFKGLLSSNSICTAPFLTYDSGLLSISRIVLSCRQVNVLNRGDEGQQLKKVLSTALVDSKKDINMVDRTCIFLSHLSSQ